MFVFLSHLFACSADISASDSWRLEKLYADNWRFFTRNPELLEDKFQKMSRSRYDFMRGTLSLYLGHIERTSSSRLESSFLTTPEASLLPILGDAHPENITICADPSQTFSAEFVDLDASDYGPWLLDLRRSAMAFRLFVSLLDDCDCERSGVQAFLEGYWSALSGQSFSLSESVLLQDLLVEAQEEGEERKKLYKYTDALQIRKDASLDEDGKGILALSSAEEREARAIFTELLNTQEEVRLLDVARRYGMGVSSLPALRYVFLWQDKAGETQMSLAREVFDPPFYPGRVGYLPVFESNAHRVDILRDQLWNNTEADPDYRTIERGNMSIKLQRWSSYFQDIELDKIREEWEEGRITQSDIEALGFGIGQLLGGVHAQGVGLSGGSSQQIIQEDIRQGGGKDILFSEIQTSSIDELRQLHSDYQWFTEQRRERGALLGMEVLR